MDKENYSIENFLNPQKTYKTFSNKIKLGHLVYCLKSNKIEIVDIEIMSNIITYEKKGVSTKVYYPIPINFNWVIHVFNFSETNQNSKKLRVFQSNIHGLKLHFELNMFRLGYIFKEKLHHGNMNGIDNYKAELLYIHELMDCLYLIKRETFSFCESDIEEINNNIKLFINNSSTQHKT